MRNDTINARELLLAGHYTCVFCGNGEILTDDRRGVKPLLDLLEKDLSDFSAADKVVGKAAALLYRLLGIAEIYASVISEPPSRFWKAAAFLFTMIARFPPSATAPTPVFVPWKPPFGTLTIQRWLRRFFAKPLLN